MLQFHHVLEIENGLGVLRGVKADFFTDRANNIHLNVHVKVEVGDSPLLNIHVGIVDVVGINRKT